jgi:hypothetical protein
MSVTEPGFTLLMAMLGGGFTVRLKAAVTEVAPLPLTVMVIVWLLTRGALLAAWSVMMPEFPVPGWVMFALTPLGRVLVASVMLPV